MAADGAAGHEYVGAGGACGSDGGGIDAAAHTA